ncbi:MAG: hypothetical protein ACE5KG_02465, partial [Nitrososphaerales archaeon]
IVDDIFNFSLAETFDIVLIDSVLQFFEQDREKEGKLLARIFDYIGVGGLVCIFIRKSLPRERYLMSLFQKKKKKWEIVVDRHINFLWTDKSSNQKSKVPFKMFFAKKLSG